jgi:hypothetical protein
MPRSSTVLTEEEIRRALHADRVIPIGVVSPHGPLGLEQLAAAVAALRKSVPPGRVRRPIELPVHTWERLRELAAATSQTGSSPITAGDLAATIIEQYVAGVTP